jgi:putative sigma-54 modulation protein
MNTEIKGIHLEVNDRIRNYMDKKLQRLDFAKDLIVDCLLSLAKGKSLYTFEATVNFRWGTSVHVGVNGFDLYQGIDSLFDKLEAKIEKEKSKIKEHRKKEAARTAEEQ